MTFGKAALAAFVLSLAATPPVTAAPVDDFAAACIKRGLRESACNCQARMARTTLDAAERRAALAAISRGREAMMTEVAAMGEAKAKAFASKMKRLGERAQKECA